MKLPAQKPLYDIVILKPPLSRSLNAADCSADLIKLRFARRLILLFRILNVAVSSVPVPGSAACRPYPLFQGDVDGYDRGKAAISRRLDQWMFAPTVGANDSDDGESSSDGAVAAVVQLTQLRNNPKRVAGVIDMTVCEVNWKSKPV